MERLTMEGLRKRGRPRDEAIGEVAIEAALSLLVEDGVRAVTMDAVARKAGTTRNAIYRRWPNAQDLLWAALERALLSAADRSQIGPPYSIEGLDFEGVLRQTMRRQLKVFTNRRFAASYLAVAAATSTNPALRLVLSRYSVLLNDIVATALQPVAEAAGLSGALIADLATGLVIYRTLMLGAALSEEDMEDVSRLIMAGCKKLQDLVEVEA